MLLLSGPETCNSVNMLRLTESLFSLRPDAEKSAYYERVLFNHILSAYDPEKGMCCYFTPMRPGHYRIYASRDSSFWCCGHTGLESPAKLGKFIYSHDSDGVRVNLFIPSVLSWKDKGVELTQHCNLLETDEVEFRLKARREQRFVLRIRKPEWMKNPTFIINGKEEELVTDSSGYCLFDRVWAHDNKIVLKYSMKPYIERLKSQINMWHYYMVLMSWPDVLGRKICPIVFGVQ